MIIVAGGDSFIYGSELQSPDHVFTALLSKQYQYSMVAWPGIGNDGIARRVINKVQSHLYDKIVVVVCWTFPGRYDFRFAYNTGQLTKEWYSITPWTIKNHKQIKKEFHTNNNSILHDHVETIIRAKKTGLYNFAEVFYKHVGSTEYWEIYSTLKEIVYLQNYLKLYRIPYLFTCADNSIIYNYTIQNGDESINSLYEQIDMTNWFWFPPGDSYQTQTPRGFYQWAVENKYPIGTTHPLEQAHYDAAILMEDRFYELVKKFVE